MSLRSFSQTQKNLTHLLVVSLLFLGYFNYFIIAEPINIFFQISSLTGQVLVNKFLTICNCTFEIVKLTYTFFQILYEDSLIFFKDATERFAFAIYLLKELYLFLEEFGWNFFNGVYQVLVSVFRILEFLQYTIWNFKQGIQILGSVIWRFFVTLPDVVILNVNAIIELLSNTFIEIRSSVCKFQEKITETSGKIFQFLFDVPFDSVCGLIIGAVLVTVFCVKFKDICYLTSSAFLKLYQQTVSFAICLWSGRFLEQRARYVEYNSEDDERLCIICQNQPKEIIIFPCKHLCLCGVCTNHLTKNQPLCPICRSEITGTLKVYL